MHGLKWSRPLIAVISTAIIIVGTLAGGQIAFAGVNPSTTPVGCGANPDDQGYAYGWWGSSATMRTENDNLYCYYVYLAGHYRIGDTYYWVSGTWVGGFPSRVETYPTGNIVEVGGSQNACEQGWTGCNGYASTLAYQ
ncbi:MAG: hypothetical protein HS107_01210 [Thermoflexaceae bacterium]|nr:hypothetical protein [Thermoflexaceae bacterium]